MSASSILGSKVWGFESLQAELSENRFYFCSGTLEKSWLECR
jgi:hypothetical protein